MKEQLIYPMVFYVAYMWLLAVLNFRTRLGAVRSGQMSHKYFRSFSGDGAITERVTIVGRHYDNQFQLPVLFLVGACAHLAVDKVDMLTVVLAWVFVATRLMHSWVHLGRNQLQKRIAAFAAGWIVNLVFWASLLA